MILCKQYHRVSLKNNMLWLILVEVNQRYDKVYLFWNYYNENEHKENVEQLKKLKNFLLNKLNLE